MSETPDPAVKTKRILFDTAETAEMLGISTRTLLGHVTAGELRYVLIGKRTRKFTQRDIDDFIEARKQCQSTVRKTRRTSTLISLSGAPGFMEARERRLAERRKPSKQS